MKDLDLVVRKWSVISAPRCEYCNGYNAMSGPRYKHDLVTCKVYFDSDRNAFCSKKCCNEYNKVRLHNDRTV